MPTKQKPGPKCLACSHPERHRIELARLAGGSLRELAEEFGLSKNTIWRHMADHVTDAQRAQYIAADVPIDKLLRRAADEGHSLLDYLMVTRSLVMTQMQYAASVNSAAGTSTLAKRMIELIREMGALTGELLRSAPGSTTITNMAVFAASPTFAVLQTMLLDRLAPYPEARTAVIAGLLDLERQQGGPPMITVDAAGGHHASAA